MMPETGRIEWKDDQGRTWVFDRGEVDCAALEDKTLVDFVRELYAETARLARELVRIKAQARADLERAREGNRLMPSDLDHSTQQGRILALEELLAKIEKP